MNDIVVENVSKTYTKNSNVHAVHNISLTVKKGTAFGFIGPNGAGKTSTIKMLVGLSQPSSGKITVAEGSPNDTKIKSQIGFMPESPLFYQYLSAYEFLEFISQLFSLPLTKIDEVLHRVDLYHARHKKIRTFSKGMLQRLGLAQAIINDPNVLFLDEPLDGLDPLGRASVKKIILDLKEQNKTIFINTHILGDVEEICDEIGILHKGKLLYIGKPRQFIKDKKDLETAFVDFIQSHAS